MPIERIGFIGLGTMGKPMALNVMKAGFPLSVYDVNPDAVQALAAAGAAACGSCKDVAAQSDAIISIVPDVPEVEAAMLGPDGVLAGARPGSIIVEMSTIDPACTRKVGAAAAERGVRMIDAPVCRSSRHAVEGKLMILVGGDEADYQECLPLLRAMGDTFHHCGPLGSGITMKLVNNCLGQSIGMAVCETLTLGVKAGLALEQMIEVVAGTAASNKMMEAAYASSAFAGDFSLGYALDWAHKDVGHALRIASREGVPMPLASQVHQWQSVARAQGKGRLDHTAILTVFEEIAGVQLRSDKLQAKTF